MNAFRIIMEVLRTAAAVVAACVLLSHSPFADAETRAQSALPGKWSFSRETIDSLAFFQAVAWQEACLATSFQCRDLAPPRVAYGLLPNQYGSFDIGSRTVLLDIRIFGQPVAVAVMFHEMVHYIQDKRRPLNTGMVTVAQACLDEEEAHRLAYKFSQDSGMGKDDPRVRHWDEAKYGYGCR